MMIIAVSFLFFIVLLCIFIVYRLNIYIETLEAKVEKQIEFTENLMQSMKEIVHENYLLADGRLKKLMIQNERTVIYNGVKVEESKYEL